VNTAAIEARLYDIVYNEAVLVSFSGGPDSVFLLDRLCAILPSTQIHLLYFNHQLRPESELLEEEALVRSLADKFDVSLTVRRLPVQLYAQRHKLSIEHAARTLRRRYLYHYASTFRYTVICTGHHQDDVHETFMYQLLKGTRRGQGIKRHDTLRDIRLFRPLLGVYKSDIVNYLDLHNIAYSTDSTNSDSVHTRNHIRKLLPELALPVNTDYKEALSDYIQYTQDIHAFLDTFTDDALSEVEVTDDLFFVPSSVLSSRSFISHYTLRRVLKRLYETFYSKERAYVTKDTVVSLYKAFSLSAGSSFDLPGHVVGKVDYDGVFFEKNQKQNLEVALDLSKTLQFLQPYRLNIFLSSEVDSFDSTLSSCALSLDSFSDSPQAIVRLAEPEDTFTPFGSDRERPLLQYFSERKVPFRDRDRIPLFFIDNHLVWVPGWHTSELCHIYPSSERLLKISLFIK
jgi:tRNA(Ile)-lysidine synthase